MFLFLFLIKCNFEQEGNNPIDNFYLKYNTREFLENHFSVTAVHFGRLYFHHKSYLIKTFAVKLL